MPRATCGTQGGGSQFCLPLQSMLPPNPAFGSTASPQGPLLFIFLHGRFCFSNMQEEAPELHCSLRGSPLLQAAAPLTNPALHLAGAVWGDHFILENDTLGEKSKPSMCLLFLPLLVVLLFLLVVYFQFLCMQLPQSIYLRSTC